MSLPQNNLTGILAIAAAGVFNGSFAVPSKKITSWTWEHIWLVFSVIAMGLLPLTLTAISAPGILSQIFGRDFLLALKVSAFGMGWGLGALLFGFSLARLGISIANALINSTIVLLGSVSPLLMGVTRIDAHGQFLLLTGLIMVLASIILCAVATIKRDKARQKIADQSASPLNSIIGIGMAVASGLLSSMLNTGFAFGTPLIERARLDGHPPLLASLIVWLPILLGGLLINFAYTVYSISSGHGWNVYWNGTKSLEYSLRCFLMGLLWFGSIFLYGYGVSQVGSSALVYGYAALTAVSILTSNAWGAITGEWTNSGLQPKMLMVFSTALLFISFFILLDR